MHGGFEWKRNEEEQAFIESFSATMFWRI